MSWRYTTFGLLSFTLALAACQPGVGPLSADEKTAIRETAAAYHEAAMAKDWDAVSEFYTEDAVVMPPNQPAVQGRAAIREWYANFPPVTELELPIGEIDGRRDLAFARGAYKLTMMIEGAPETIADRGKNLAIWRKQTDGSWRIAIDTFNSDLPLPPMEREE